MAEAMALGKPVIATGYSGNLHFMTPENSFLVGYSRARVPAGCAPYPTTTEWAEPDEKEAVALMRDVYERPDAARERGAKARQDILERHTLQTSAQAVRARVEAIRAERRKRVAVSDATPPVPPPPPAMGVEHLEALLGPLNDLATLRLSADGRPLRGLRLLAQRTLFRILRPLWFQQHQFFAQVVGAFRLTSAAIRAEQLAREAVDTRLRELTRRVLSSRREVDRLGRTFEQLEGQRRRQSGGEVPLERRLGEAERREADRPFVGRSFGEIASTIEAKTRELSIGISNLQTAESTFQQNAAAHLEALTAAVQKSERDAADLWARLFASPYMADAARYVDKDPHGNERLGYHTRRDSARRGVYVGFEDVFRGPETLVRARQQPYVALLEGRAQVVDLGCGRGEMLDLLRDGGVPSTGVDQDADMVAICQAKGHTVVHQDALTFMRGQAPRSLPAVFSAQMIEHLPFAALKELLELTHTRLQPGGVAIFETVNPHALEAFKTFYTDLTHEHPIFPEVALAWCELVGFDEAYVLFPRGTGELMRDRQSQGEYAIVATVRLSQ